MEIDYCGLNLSNFKNVEYHQGGEGKGQQIFLFSAEIHLSNATL